MSMDGLATWRYTVGKRYDRSVPDDVQLRRPEAARV